MTLKRKTNLKHNPPKIKQKGVKVKRKRKTAVKTTKKDKLLSWGLPEKYQWHHLRYKKPYQKGVYWYWFSLEIRQRDVDKFGTCISCSKPITVDTSQAGHFIPASRCGRDLLFDFWNVNAECYGCNHRDTRKLRYEKNLIHRYGDVMVEALKERYHLYDSGSPIKDFTVKEYEEKIAQLGSFNSRKT